MRPVRHSCSLRTSAKEHKIGLSVGQKKLIDSFTIVYYFFLLTFNASRRNDLVFDVKILTFMEIVMFGVKNSNV